jgi:ribosomal protein L24E
MVKTAGNADKFCHEDIEQGSGAVFKDKEHCC